MGRWRRFWEVGGVVKSEGVRKVGWSVEGRGRLRTGRINGEGIYYELSCK